MSRHSSVSSYYQPSSRPDSPAPFSSTASSSSNPQQQQQQQQQQHPPPQQPPAPQQPPPPPRNQKADQILQNFYVKVIQIVVLARVTNTDVQASTMPKKGSLRGMPLVKKTSKWFNLELEDLDVYKEDAKFWRAVAVTDTPPAMLVELLLDTSELSPNQMLVLVDENNRKNRVDITGPSTASSPLGQGRQRRNIILESWSLTLSNTLPDPVPEPPVVYKKSIIFFRSLYAYMRLLPAYQLYRRLRTQNHGLKIGFRVSRGHSPEESMFRDSEIGIELPLVEGETRPMLSEYRFGQVETPIGAFSLKVTYRSNCDFHVDESEAVLSSRFFEMDEHYFTPTIVTHSQESGSQQRRSTSSTLMTRRPSSDMYISGNFPEHFTPIPSLRPRRNSAQSLQHRSGENSSSQSSVSSLGARMSRRDSSGAPGSLLSPIDQHNPGGTPPFSLTHGGHAAVAKHYVDPIMESPPFKLGMSQTDHRRPLSSTFSPFKSPSLSSSPSPSYLEALPSSLSSRPSSIHLNRSPSSSSMHRIQSSQQGSGLIGSIPKSGGALATNIVAGSSTIPTPGANLLSTSAKSNASSTSAPRVTSSFGHRHDSSSRRASSESLPSNRGNRNSVIGSSSLFQLIPDDDDVNAFVRMLNAPEPLKMFEKASGSGIGPSFTSGDISLSASALRAKSTLDKFQQLKQSNASLTDSMSASQLISKDQRQSGSPLPLTIATGHQRRSNLSDLGPSSPTGLAFAVAVPLTTVNRHSQSFTHQPPTPSPLHSEIPVNPGRSSGRSESQQAPSFSTTRHNTMGSTPTKRLSWLIGGSNSSSGSNSIFNLDQARKGSNIGSTAFRHGSLDQGKDILGMEEVMGRMGIGAPDEIAYGSFPEDVHHQHSLYSAPLITGRGREAGGASGSPALELPFGPNPRPIPSLASEETSTSRPGRPLRLGSGSSGTSFTLPRLRTRAADDNESLNEMISADSSGGRRDEGRNRSRDEDEDDEDEYEDSREIRSGRDGDYKHGANTSINDDDDMLFFMSEVSPSSTSGQEAATVVTGPAGTMSGAHERGLLPLAGAILNLRSQSQSPTSGSHRGNGGNGGVSSTVSSHLRIFGRSGNNANLGNDNNSSSNNSSSSNNNGSRSTSANHSRVGSSSGSNTNNHNSIENLGFLRRPGSGSGFMDDFSVPPASSTPPFPGASTGAGAFEAMLEGRRMSRGGSDRGAGSGTNSAGHNSFHSDSRGGRIEGW